LVDKQEVSSEQKRDFERRISAALFRGARDTKPVDQCDREAKQITECLQAAGLFEEVVIELEVRSPSSK
jgi:hypothetical protein